ncbi:MAG: hypothetical protein HY596_01175 [Candidatus Omnitrophica bacterium]|nr:hypothetical protein [Candidatus Omnitrophota bacterium]
MSRLTGRRGPRRTFVQRGGQSTVELAVLVAVITGALLAMQIYVKRGAMGKLRDAADQAGEQFTPLNTTSEFTVTRNSARTEKTEATGLTTATLTQDDQTRTGAEQVTTRLDEEKLFKQP